MPHVIKKVKGKFKIIKKRTGKVVGTSTNKNDAMASIRARFASESGRKVKKS